MFLLRIRTIDPTIKIRDRIGSGEPMSHFANSSV
jgi:hypothetical protein